MPTVLYHYPASPPSRLALTVAKTVGVDVTIKIVDIFAHEHIKEDYLKINPEHSIPTLDDNGFIIWDSHVIATYFISQYAKDDSLYPKDPKKRALVDQRLYFDAATLFVRLKNITYPLMFLGKPDVPQEKKRVLYEAIDNLEKYVEPTGWVAGDHATVADIALAITTRSLQEIGFDISKCPKIKEWLQRVSNKFPVLDEVNQQGEKDLREALRNKVAVEALAR